MRSVVRYVLIGFMALIGCLALLLYWADQTARPEFASAIECPDPASPHCFQLSNGVILSAPTIHKNISGQEYEVVIATRGKKVDLFLQPSTGDASVIVAGAPVAVEWWLGNPVSVFISDRRISTTDSPEADHSVFVYVGLVLLWIAAISLVLNLINRRMAAAAFALRVAPVTPVPVVAVIKPRIQDALLPAVIVGLIALLSVKPLFDAGLRTIVLAADLVVLGPIAVRTILNLRNGALKFDADSVTQCAWNGRPHRWAISQIKCASVVSVQWSDLGLPALRFIGTGDTELFTVSSVMWDLRLVAGACLSHGIDVFFGDPRDRRRGINWARQAERLVVLLPVLVMVVLSLRRT